MESPFTVVDNSIDIVGAIFFGVVIFWVARYLFENHLPIRIKIVYAVMIALSGAHIYQTGTQVLNSDFASFRIWDFINYATAFPP